MAMMKNKTTKRCKANMKFMLPMTVLWICLLLRLLSLFSCHPFYYGPNILHAAIYKLRIIAAQSVEHFWRPVEPSNGRAVEQFWPTCTQGYYIHNNLQCRLIYLPSCCPHVLSVMCRFLLFLLLLSFQTLSIKPLNWTNFFDEPFFFLSPLDQTKLLTNPSTTNR